MARPRLDLPWHENEPEWAVRKCFDAWRASRGGDGSGEMVAGLAAIRAAIERHREARFRNLDKADTAQHPIRDLLGYRFTREGEVLWSFTATGWGEVLA